MSEHRRMIQHFMCERAERQINALSKAKKSKPPDNQDENIDMPQIYYHKYLLKCAESVEPVPMQKSWIENILKKSGSVRWKNNNILGFLIEEIKAHYITNSKQFYVDSTILPLPNLKYEPEGPQSKPLTRPGLG
eukprot:XP_016665071.1 PREDICTED: uncharacterized protein LOC107885876 [Acyrthosiphon pisum]